MSDAVRTRGEVLLNEMEQTFRLPPARWSCPALLQLGYVALIPAHLEAAMRKHHHCRVPNEGQSMEEWVREHYGEAAVALVHRAITGGRL